MRTSVCGVAASLVAALLLAPAAVAADEEAPVPEGYEAPRSQLTVTKVWTVPLSTVGKFWADPKKVDTADLEESLGAKDKGDQKQVTLSDRFLFDFGSAELRDSAESSLDTLAALLAEGKGDIEIIGHTDNVGGDAVNQPLSQDRAQAPTTSRSRASTPAA